MRRAKYSAKKVYLPNVSLIGFGVYFAKPGHWVAWTECGQDFIGRVLGRIDETARDGLENCDGWLAVMTLSRDATHAYVRWIDPRLITRCLERPPVELMAWLTGADWPKSARDIPRVLAMAQHGTCSESCIASRNDPTKPYNARPEYVEQFVLGSLR